ncbi:DUF4259 domain-containing protein [Streptomyces sp. NPDC088922]|uniref:DUF4259 domain-containing protein n=1 Tax=Streptomyces sp. NPDC088922 TaxID=3156671 RepID=UPI00344FC2B6
MGTWGTGPFDNDSAADYALLLDRSGVPEVLLRHALCQPDSTTAESCEVMVAAAAVIASSCPGGEPLHPVYGPHKPLPPLPHDLRELAAAALVTILTRPPQTYGWVSEQLLTHWLSNRPTARGARSDASQAAPVGSSPISGLSPHPDGARLGPPSPLTSPTQQGPS